MAKIQSCTGDVYNKLLTELWNRVPQQSISSTTLSHHFPLENIGVTESGASCQMLRYQAKMQLLLD